MSNLDESAFLWQRNVKDEYKNFSNEKIKTHLQNTAFPFAILMSQVEHDFNIGSVIRSSNFFGCFNIFYYGPRKKFDPRGAVGAHHYINLKHLKSFEEIKDLKNKYTFVGMENNVKNTIPLKDFIWDEKSLIIIGEEKNGIPPDFSELIDHFVEIPAFGSVRSLNAGCAASIALYDYVSKYK
jgi:tRNA G18 (ribose-2'-O)-methylase SpoU